MATRCCDWLMTFNNAPCDWLKLICKFHVTSSSLQSIECAFVTLHAATNKEILSIHLQKYQNHLQISKNHNSEQFQCGFSAVPVNGKARYANE